MSDTNIRLLLSSLSLDTSLTSNNGGITAPSLSCRDALTTLSLILSSHQDAYRSFIDHGGVNMVLHLLGRTSDAAVAEGCLCVLSNAVKSSPEAKSVLRCHPVMSKIHRVLSGKVMGRGGGVTDPVHVRLGAALVMELAAESTQGQGMARHSGCLHDLVQLFRELAAQVQQKSVDAWVTVCQAIGNCLTNPQNLQNQEEVASILPETIHLLESWIHKPDAHHYRLVTLTGMILNVVAENPANQEKFAKAGGVEATARCVLAKVPLALDRNLVLLLGVVLQGNPAAIRSVQGLNIIPFLLARLHQVDDQTKSVYLLTMAHMIGSSEEQRKVFLRSGGESLVRWETDQKDAKSRLRHVAECLLHIGTQSNKSSVSADPLVTASSFLPHPHYAPPHHNPPPHPSAHLPHLPHLIPQHPQHLPRQPVPPPQLPPLMDLTNDPSPPDFPQNPGALFLQHPAGSTQCGGGGKGNSAGDSGIESGCAALMPPPPLPPPLNAQQQLVPPQLPPLLAPPPLLPMPSGGSSRNAKSGVVSLASGGNSSPGANNAPSTLTTSAAAPTFRSATQDGTVGTLRAGQDGLFPDAVTAVLQPLNRNQASERSNGASQLRVDLDRAKAVAVFQASTFVSVVYRRDESAPSGGGTGAVAGSTGAVAGSTGAKGTGGPAEVGGAATDDPSLLDEAHGKSRFLQEWLEQLRPPDATEAESLVLEDDRFLQRLREERDREEGMAVGSEEFPGAREDAPSYAGAANAAAAGNGGGLGAATAAARQVAAYGGRGDNLDSVSARESPSTQLSSTKTGSRRKRRVEYTEEETRNILEGVKRFGTNFKDIRKFYKFHPSRTPVSLYDKWRHSLKPREESGSRVTASGGRFGDESKCETHPRLIFHKSNDPMQKDTLFIQRGYLIYS